MKWETEDASAGRRLGLVAHVKVVRGLLVLCPGAGVTKVSAEASAARTFPRRLVRMIDRKAPCLYPSAKVGDGDENSGDNRFMVRVC